MILDGNENPGYDAIEQAILNNFCFERRSIQPKMSEQESKRQRVSDLLDADVAIAKICEIVGVSRATVFNVKARKTNGGEVNRKEGSGGSNKRRSEEFLTGVAAQIETAPTTSMRTMAKELNVSERTIRRSVQDLGASS